MVFVLVGKDFLGQVIKVEFAEKRVPKGGFGRGGGGRGAVVFQFFALSVDKILCHIAYPCTYIGEARPSKMLCSSRQYPRKKIASRVLFSAF